MTKHIAAAAFLLSVVFASAAEQTDPMAPLMFSPSATAQTFVPNGLAYLRLAALSISAGGAVITIKADGTVEYSRDYTPDEAARAFWEAVARSTPFCKPPLRGTVE